MIDALRARLRGWMWSKQWEVWWTLRYDGKLLTAKTAKEALRMKL
jgi:hypothetical protein